MVSLLDCMQLKFDWMVGPLHGPIVLRLYWCLDSGVENHRIEFFWCINLSLLLTDEGAITPKLVSGWD